MMKKLTILMVALLASWSTFAQWDDLNPGGGGQIQDVVCDPNVPGRLYLSSDMEGVYRSEDNGVSWQYTSDELVHARSFITTIDPNNSNRIYVGTMYGLSISDNKGDNYFFAEETADNSIGAISVDPFNSDHIIAAAGWKDDYDFWPWGIGRVASSGPGHYFESWDYGVTWDQVEYNTVTDQFFNVYSVEFDKTRNGTIYIAGDQGLYKTSDWGANWSLIAGPTPYMCRGVKLSPNGNYLYAAYSTDNGDYFNVGANSKFYATRTSTIDWKDITGGLNYTAQMWYPEVDPRSTGNSHEIMISYRNQRTGVWKGSVTWNGATPTVTWANILKEGDNFDTGWDTWYENPNVRWAHFTPTSWDATMPRGIWATGNQTVFSGTQNGGTWNFLNKYSKPSNIITPATGEPTYETRGFSNTYAFDGSAYMNYAIQVQGDNGVQESWDYGTSWNNHSVREFNRNNHADAVDFAVVDGVKTVVCATGQGWGGTNLSGHTLMTKKLTTLTPSDTWQGRNGNLPTNYNVTMLRVSPHNDKSVIMGIYGSGIWWIEDIKNFINGGSAVQIASPTNGGIAGANSIAFHPTDPNIVYLTANIHSNDTGNQTQHLYEGKRTGGSWAWTIINDGIGWGASVSSWRSGSTNYLAYAGQLLDPATGSYNTNMSVQLSTNGGTSWTTIMNKETTLPLKDHSWYDYISNRFTFNYSGMAGTDNQLFLACYDHSFGKPYGALKGTIESDNSVTWEDWTGDMIFPGMTRAQIKTVAGKKYYYGATAGTGLWRREILPTGTGGPNAPSNMTASNSGGGIQLNWSDNSGNETGFRLERGNDGEGYAVFKTVGAGVTTYTDAGFCPGKTFKYRVRAINGSGVSSPSGVASATSIAPGLSAGSANGLIAEYFDNIDFTNLVATGIEEPINFNWQRTGPNTCIDVDTWSARWTGNVTAPTSGTYTFQITGDDAVSLWVNNALIASQSVEDPNDPVSGTFSMTAGQAVPIKIEFQEDGWDANLVLKWSTGGAAFTVVPASALSSTGGGGTTVIPTSVSITGCNSGTNMTVGSTRDLDEGVAPSNATNKSVTWSSSNTNVATVNSSGVVAAVAAGTATITVTTNSGNKTATCAVTVVSGTIVPTSVSINGCPGSNMTIGNTATLTRAIQPTNATNQNVTWSSSNTSVATVNASGIVTAVAAGSATITVTTNSGNKTATCAVTVNASTGGCTNPNKVSNGELDNGQANWGLWTGGGATASYAVVTNGGLSGANSAKITIGGAGTTAGHLQFFQPIGAIENGKTYEVLYQAKAAAARNIVVGVLKHTDPWTGIKYESVNLTTSAQSYSMEFTATFTENEARIDFFLGNSTVDVWIDGVILREKCTTSTVIPTSVAISGCSSTNLTVGSTRILSATVLPSNATNKNVTWSSSNASVASVSSTGVVTAVGAGTATITATTVSGSKTSTCAVTSVSATVIPTSVSISGCPGSNMAIGNTANLNETVSPSNATNKNVTWSSSNTSVATVSNTGLVTAVAAGSATITVTTVSGSKTSTCGVTVTAPSGNSSVTLRARLTNGSSDDLQLRVNDATVKTWTITSSSFANYTVSVPLSGNVKVYFPDNGTDMELDYIIVDGTTYQAESQAVNTAVWQGQCGGSYSSLMHCSGHIDFGTINGGTSPVIPTSVSISGCQSSLTVGSTASLSATVSPSNATNKNVTWSTSNSSVATVSSAGLVTAVAAGSATITVTTVSGSKTSTCGVTVTAPSGGTSYRYLRLTGTGTVGNDVTLQQIHWMVGSNSYPNPKLDWATRWNSWASNSDSNNSNVYGAFDNTNGGWSVGSSYPAWIVIDLGAGNAITPNAIMIKPNASDRGFSGFTCHGSNDNANWTQLYSTSGLTTSTWSGGLTTFNFGGSSREGLSPMASLSRTQIEVYPNPMEVGSTITIDPMNLKAFDVQVISVSGHVVFKESFEGVSGTFDMNIKELDQPGIYFIRFISAGGVATQKLMVK